MQRSTSHPTFDLDLLSKKTGAKSVQICPWIQAQIAQSDPHTPAVGFLLRICCKSQPMIWFIFLQKNCKNPGPNQYDLASKSRPPFLAKLSPKSGSYQRLTQARSWLGSSGHLSGFFANNSWNACCLKQHNDGSIASQSSNARGRKMPSILGLLISFSSPGSQSFNLWIGFSLHTGVPVGRLSLNRFDLLGFWTQNIIRTDPGPN